MEISELSQKMHELVESKGWYAPDSPHPQTPRNLAASVAIEAAEILEHFQWQSHPEIGDFISGELAGELADVALYLLQLARVCEIDLERAILDKLALNSTRSWDTPEENG